MAANDFAYASMPLPTDIPVKNTEASADIAAGNTVKLDATNVVSGTQGLPGVLIAGASDYILGVAMEAIPNGKAGRVRTQGIVQVVASAAVTAGDVLKSAASGKCATQTAAAPQIGQALTAAAGNNDKVLAILQIAKNA